MNYKLRDVVSFKPGYAFKKDEMSDCGFPLIKIKSIKNNKVVLDPDSNINKSAAKKGYEIRNGDILMALTGDPVTKGSIETWAGRSGIYENNEMSFLNQRVCKIIPNEAVLDNKYLYYWLIRPEKTFEIASLYHGSANQANISHKDVGELQIDLPDIRTQKKISTILSNIDEKILINNRTNDNLYKIGRSIYDHYETTESKRVPVKKILNFTRGFEPGSASYKEDENGQMVRFVRVGDMDSLAGSTFIDKKIASIFVEPDDILISFDASIGRVAFGVCGAYSSGIRNVYSVKNDIPKSFIYYYLTSKNAQDTISENATGTTIKHASKAIDYMTMPFSEKTSGIYQALDSIFDKQLSIKAENERLTKLRDTLLPELLNGKIDVSNIDI